MPRLADLELDEPGRGLVWDGGLASSSSSSSAQGPLEEEWAEGARLSAEADGSWSSSVSSESSESVSRGGAVVVGGVDVGLVRWRSLLGGGDGEGDGELRESRERVELAIVGDDEQERGL